MKKWLGKVALLFIGGALGMLCTALVPAVQQFLGIDVGVVSSGADPLQINIDFQNALKRFRADSQLEYDSLSHAWSSQFRRLPGVLQKKTTAYVDRRKLEVSCIVDSFLTAYRIAGGDTTALSYSRQWR